MSQYTGPRPLQPSPPGAHGHNDPGEQQPITGLATDPELQSEAGTSLRCLGYSLQVRRRWGRHRVLAGPGLTRGVISEYYLRSPGRHQDDPTGAGDTSKAEQPQQDSVKHRGHVFPVIGNLGI